MRRHPKEERTIRKLVENDRLTKKSKLYEESFDD